MDVKLSGLMNTGVFLGLLPSLVLVVLVWKFLIERLLKSAVKE